MKVINVAQVPAPTISITATIQDSIPRLRAETGCALAVVAGERLVGTLSRQDVLERVVAARRDPKTTLAGEAMTTPAPQVLIDSDVDAALELMFSRRLCHLAVVDSSGNLRGWLAICQLFQDGLDDLKLQLDSLAAYTGADGAGGD